MKREAKRSAVVLLVLLAMCFNLIGCSNQKQDINEQIVKDTEVEETTKKPSAENVYEIKAPKEPSTESVEEIGTPETTEVEIETEKTDTVNTNPMVYILPKGADEWSLRIPILLNAFLERKDGETLVDTLERTGNQTFEETYSIDTLQEKFLSTGLPYCCKTNSGNWIILTGVDQINNIVYYLTETGAEEVSSPEALFSTNVDVISILILM